MKEEACAPNWLCYSWGPCDNNRQSRAEYAMRRANKCTGRILSAFFSNMPAFLTLGESHEELVAELLHVLIDFLSKMVQEMIHLLALGLADFFRNPPPFGVDFLEILFRKAADLLGLLLGEQLSRNSSYQSGVRSC